MQRIALLLAGGLVALAAQPAHATAAGVPVLGFSTQARSTTNGYRSYVVRAAGRGTRVVARTRAGRTLASARLPRRLVVPEVAFDGSVGSLSTDGRTLILVGQRTRFPQAATTLALLETERLRLRRMIHLRGDFSFDAVSPTGRWVYLIQYTAAADPTRYRVRALDTLTGHLLARAIVDPRDREAMGGIPVTRVTSADGRWAYTLYTGTQNFVHALDTSRLSARCLDLPAFPRNANPYSARLRLHHGRLLVMVNRHTLAVIDTRRLTVRVPRPSSRRVATRRASLGLAAPAAAAALLVLLSAIALTRSGRARGRTRR